MQLRDFDTKNRLGAMAPKLLVETVAWCDSCFVRGRVLIEYAVLCVLGHRLVFS